MPEYWSTGIKENWNTRELEYWSTGIQENWNTGVHKYSNTQCLVLKQVYKKVNTIQVYANKINQNSGRYTGM